MPPQIPWFCRVRRANARHSGCTSQAAHTAFALVTRLRPGPEFEIGKNISGSKSRQAALAHQSRSAAGRALIKVCRNRAMIGLLNLIHTLGPSASPGRIAHFLDVV
jgi:hypothetical protein